MNGELIVQRRRMLLAAVACYDGPRHSSPRKAQAHEEAPTCTMEPSRLPVCKFSQIWMDCPPVSMQEGSGLGSGLRVFGPRFVCSECWDGLGLPKGFPCARGFSNLFVHAHAILYAAASGNC